MSHVADERTSESRRGLLGSSVLMAVGTTVSRITGFVKNVCLVLALGSALFADTFNLANSIPTSIYILVAGGALNAVFVPQLVRAMKEDPDGGQAFGQRLLTATALLLLTISVLAVLAAPWLIRIWGSDDMLAPENQAYFDLTVTFARYCLPQIFFFGIYAILGQVLNARGVFGPMMWSPILNNLVGIGVFVTFIVVGGAAGPGEITAGEEALLGLGTSCGIALQALALLPVLRRTGFSLRPRFDLWNAGLGKSFRLATWTLGFVLVNQLWFLVATKLTTGVSAQAEAVGVSEGLGLTPYQTAFFIFQLPHGIVVVSLVTALLPRMSRAAAAGRVAEVAADISHGLRVVAVALLPAVAAFLALGPLLAVAIYNHGETSRDSAQVIGYVLMGFAPGLLGFSSHYTVLRGFYAYEDTRTPATIQLVVMLSSATAAFAAYTWLPLEWKTVGIAGAYGLGYWAGFGVSQAMLRRRLRRIGAAAGPMATPDPAGPAIPDFQAGRILGTYLRAGSAALLAGLLGFGVSRLLVGWLGDDPMIAFLAVAVGGLLIASGYLGFARLFGVRELTELTGIVARVRRRRRD